LAKTHRITAQSLTAMLKSARAIMRKDKGLNGDLDRLPMVACRSSRREEAQSEKSDVRCPKSKVDQSLVTSAASSSRD
jgi:hypothetical protein